MEAARRFIDELADNPEAELPDPGEAKVECTESRIPEPPRVNSGPGEEVPPVLEGVHAPFFENPTRAALMRIEAGPVGDTGEGR